MVGIKVFIAGECRRAKVVPVDLQGLKKYVEGIVGDLPVFIKYKDEEGDLVSICTEDEYQDFLSLCTSIAKLYIEPVNPSELSNFSILNLSNSTQQSIWNRSSDLIPKPSTEVKPPPNPSSQPNPVLLASIRNILKSELSTISSMQSSNMPIQHLNISCSICQANPICGVRYKCSECSVNLCESCESTSDHEHPFFKIRNPEAIENPTQHTSKALQVVRQKISNFHSQETKLFESNLKYLAEMGFTYEQCVSALTRYNNNLEYALNALTIAKDSN